MSITVPVRTRRRSGWRVLSLALVGCLISASFLGFSAGQANAGNPPGLPVIIVQPSAGSAGPAAPGAPPPSTGGNGGGGTNGGCVAPPGATCGALAGFVEGDAFFPNLPPVIQVPGQPYAGQCAGGTAFGAYIGVHWTILVTFSDAAGTVSVATTFTCIAPPTFSYTSAACAWSVGAFGDGPSNNPVVGSTRFFSAAPVLSPFAAGGGTNPALCVGSFSRAFSTTAPAAYGIYRVTGTGTQVNCLLKTFTAVDPRTGAVPASQFVGCGPQYPVSNQQAAATVWCGGVQLGANTGHSFTPDECKGQGGAGGWSCRVGNPTVDGRNLPLNTIFADGTGHAVSWGGSPGFGGAIRNVRNGSSKLTVLPGSTPFRSNEPNPDKQPFAVTPGYGGYQNGFVPEWRTQWFGNSDTIPTVLPWKAAVDYRFLGDFSGLSLKITGVTVNDNAPPTIQYSVVPITYTATATCTGGSVSVVAQRSRNTN